MSDLVVRPVRFTDNVEHMRRFLEALGLRPRVEAAGGGWVDLVAGAGMVALHSAKDSERQAPSGLTSLSFEAVDIDVLANRLESAGVADVVVYDEAYGRVLTCRDPLGDQIAVDERSADPYGYRVHEPTGVRPGWRVMPIRFADPLGPYGGFLSAFGLEPRGEPNAHFTAYALGGGDDGLVGLHPPTERQLADGSRPMTTESGAVALSFETAEDLSDVADRLGAAGFEPRIRTEVFGDVLAVLDGDGQDVEVDRSVESTNNA
jgi:hypothetical protein